MVSKFEERTANDKITSGQNLSYWIDSITPLQFDRLERDIKTDVLIIGAGIAGLTTAYCLTLTGRKVVVVEDGFVGSGESGRTTAHLTNALDDRYYELESLYGEEKTKMAAASHTAAIDWIEKTITKENIDCDFLRVNGYLFLHPTDKKESLEKELNATQKAGLKTELIESVIGIPVEKGECLKFPGQGQFHIMKYLHALAKAIVGKGGKILTSTHARHINEKGAIANGHNVSASQIVVATNTPINDLVTIHTKQFPYRTYVIAALIPKDKIAPALWWDTGNQESKWITHPYHYVRLQPYNTQFNLLIAGGEDHKTGQADKENINETERYDALEKWVRKRFPVGETLYRWSGQVMEPLDSLAFIGKNPGNENVYIITGDSGNGMTHGTLGGLIISDLINEIGNPWADLYKPTRIPLKVAGNYIKETMGMAAQYTDWLTKGDIESAADLEPNEGGIISSGLKKIAVYRDTNNRLHIFNATCPHLGCVVQWNAEEKTFDCPCHGSRFTNDGIVINGPATENLENVAPPKE